MNLAKHFPSITSFNPDNSVRKELSSSRDDLGNKAPCSYPPPTPTPLTIGSELPFGRLWGRGAQDLWGHPAPSVTALTLRERLLKLS